MKRVLTIAALGLTIGTLAAMPAWAWGNYSKVKGEVVMVETQVRLANGAEFDRLTIKTRNQEMIHLDLGPGGACEGCFQAGDLVRARVRTSTGAGGAMQVQSLRLRHGDQQFHYLNDGGKMVPGGPGGRGGRSGVGIHDRDRDRDRVHAPAQGGGAGPGAVAAGCRRGGSY